jgi:two-component system CheB/CheR fusion protein
MLADQLLLKKFAPSAVLVTAHGDIVYFSGKTGKYLEPPAGKANLNLFAMLRPSLRQPVSDIFYRTVRQKLAATLDAVSLGEDGSGPAVRISVEPLEEPKALDGMLMVVFSDIVSVPIQAANAASGESGHDARVAELMLELARSREEHQATREEMQTSQEELKSANEELQSANEELTTSREEMQSMNEELQTVNSELQTRVDALARASDDMENLLNSTDIATLFLDRLLHVRRFTTRATNIIKLIPGDIGRPLSDLTTDLKVDLSSDAADVLRTLMFKEKDVEAAGSRWFRVRIMPYRTQDNRIDGVVITFTDITASKQVEATLRGMAALG